MLMRNKKDKFIIILTSILSIISLIKGEFLMAFSFWVAVAIFKKLKECDIDLKITNK